MAEEIEYVDIVNEKDEIVGKTTREEATEKKLRYRVAKVLVFDSQNNLIIQKRTPTRRMDPNVWDICMGETVISGESHKEAAIRGLNEEYEIRGVDVELITKFSYENEFKKRWTHVFRCVYDGEINFDKNEISEIKKIKFEELKEFMKHNEFISSSQKIIERLGW